MMVTGKITDRQRIDWLSKQDGAALINDDNGQWAFSSAGIQPVIFQESDKYPYFWTTYTIEPHAFAETIRGAIDKAINEQKA